MRKKNTILLATLFSVFSLGLTATHLANGNIIGLIADGKKSTANSVSITRNTSWNGNYDTSVTTATTEKGNQLKFDAINFDIRNGTGNWNNCIVFDGSRGPSRFWNRTELYGITSIKIYNYNLSEPDSYANLCTQSFTFFYGYESINFNDEYYVAKQTTSTGMIEFPAGYEPSFFGIQGNFDTDICVSKIEINYLCEQVEGEFVNSGEARLYDSEKRTFEYSNGNSVVVREYGAPLARETAALEHEKSSWNGGVSSYNPSTHSWTTTRDDHILIDRADAQPFPARKGRDTILVTLMVSKAEGFTGWNGASDVYIGVNRTSSETKCQSRFSTQNTASDYTSWVFLADGFEIYDVETGLAATGPIWDMKVTIEFDISTVDKIYNITLGTSNAYQKFTLYDISFRDNCSHEHLENYSTGYSFGHKCYRCGKILDRYVDSLSYHNYSGKSSDNFTYQTGVSFAGMDHCLKTVTVIKTNDADGGWSQNYQVRLAGLIANARATESTTIRFKFYVESASNFNTRFQWGLWNNSTSKIEDFALLDHYNGPLNAGYTSDLAVDMVTSVTKLDGTPAGDNGRTNAAYANQWVVMTMDVSSSDFANLELFFSPAVDANSAVTYPINVYIADLELIPYSRYLIENKDLKYNIKVNNDENSRYAADEIHDHIYEATGKNIPVITLGNEEIVNSDAKSIIIGSTFLANRAGITFNPSTSKGSYLLKTDSNNVFLLANSKDGYLLGAHKFIEKVLGYDHYGKDTYSYDSIGQSIPIPYLNIDHTTAFEYRRCDDSDFTWSDGDKLLYNSGNWTNKNPLIMVNGVQKYHNSTLIIDPDTYKSSHPKWYSANKYGITKTDQLCYTARGNSTEYNALVNTTADKIIEAFQNDTNLSRDTLCFGMADNREYCHCSACTSAASNYGGSLAGTVVNFLNDVYDVIAPRVSETNRSNIYLYFLAYYSYEQAPTNITCNDHVGVIIAPILANYTESITSDYNYSKYGVLFSDWSNVCSKIDTWLYETNFQNYLYPLNTYKATTESITYLASLGSINTIYTQGQHNVTAPRTGFNALKKYLNAKFMDDPSSNYDELVDKFFAHYYGEGGSTMRIFFDQLVERMEYNEANKASILYDDPSVPKAVGQKVANASLWDYNELVSWVSLCESAMNSTTSQTCKDNILAESIFPRFALCCLYTNKYSSSELLALRTSFKNDCNKLGINRWKEGGNSLQTDYFDDWGV